MSDITDGKPKKTTGAVTLQIASRFDERIVIEVETIILNQLAINQACQLFDVDDGGLAKAPFEDPNYSECGKIDLLLEIEALLVILESGKLYNAGGVPIAQNSVFGDLVGGHFSTSHAIETEGRVVISLSVTISLAVVRTSKLFANSDRWKNFPGPSS